MTVTITTQLPTELNECLFLILQIFHSSQTRCMLQESVPTQFLQPSSRCIDVLYCRLLYMTCISIYYFKRSIKTHYATYVSYTLTDESRSTCSPSQSIVVVSSHVLVRVASQSRFDCSALLITPKPRYARYPWFQFPYKAISLCNRLSSSSSSSSSSAGTWLGAAGRS